MCHPAIQQYIKIGCKAFQLVLINIVNVNTWGNDLLKPWLLQISLYMPKTLNYLIQINYHTYRDETWFQSKQVHSKNTSNGHYDGLVHDEIVF